MSENSKIELHLACRRRHGVLKTAAKRIGIDFEAYVARLERGDRWCTACKDWHPPLGVLDGQHPRLRAERVLPVFEADAAQRPTNR